MEEAQERIARRNAIYPPSSRSPIPMPHFRPQDLFSNSSSSLPPIPAHSGVFLTGPLSVSSLLHLALHHLSSPLRPDAPEQRGVDSSDRARGKQPERARHVLILSPVRAALRSALVEENDLALAGDTNGRSIQRLEKVEIKSVPVHSALSSNGELTSSAGTFLRPRTSPTSSRRSTRTTVQCRHTMPTSRVGRNRKRIRRTSLSSRLS